MDLFVRYIQSLSLRALQSFLPTSSLLYCLSLCFLVYSIWPAFSSLPFALIALWTQFQIECATWITVRCTLTRLNALAWNHHIQVYFDLWLGFFLGISVLIYESWSKEGLCKAGAGLVAWELAAVMFGRPTVRLIKWSIGNAYIEDPKPLLRCFARVTLCICILICACLGLVPTLLYLLCKWTLTLIYLFQVFLSNNTEALLPDGQFQASMSNYCTTHEDISSFLKRKATDAVALYGSLTPAFLHCLLHSLRLQGAHSELARTTIYENIQLYCLGLKDLRCVSHYCRECLLESLFHSPSPYFFHRLIKSGYLPLSAKVGRMPFALRFSKYALLNGSQDAEAIRQFLSQYAARAALFWGKSQHLPLLKRLPTGALGHISSFL